MVASGDVRWTLVRSIMYHIPVLKACGGGVGKGGRRLTVELVFVVR